MEPAPDRPEFLGDGVDPGRPCLTSSCEQALDTGKSYYLFALPVLVVVTLLARNVRTGGFGRLLTAIRDNEDAARAFTVPAVPSEWELPELLGSGTLSIVAVEASYFSSADFRARATSGEFNEPSPRQMHEVVPPGGELYWSAH